MESVGQATWSHSMRAVRPGGTIVVTGATTGPNPPAYLTRILWDEIRVVGSHSGTLTEMHSLISFMRHKQLRPDITAILPFASAQRGFRMMLDGNITGKIVFSW
jgi:D-arabinose 1-dehydrogenase-like Zn-dependent alcohol dehydrogenase